MGVQDRGVCRGGELILSDREIKKRVGMIEPFCDSRLSGASYDVALHRELLVENDERGDHFLPLKMFDSGYRMENQEFLLAATEEVLTVPLDIACEFRLKSSNARLGLDHHLAIWADPGFHGRLTLELSNNNRFHLVHLRPGMLIGQFIFHELSSPAERSYKDTGRYWGDMTVQASKVVDD